MSEQIFFFSDADCVEDINEFSVPRCAFCHRDTDLTCGTISRPGIGICPECIHLAHTCELCFLTAPWFLTLPRNEKPVFKQMYSALVEWRKLIGIIEDRDDDVEQCFECGQQFKKQKNPPFVYGGLRHARN